MTESLEKYFQLAADEAKNSTCLRALCGSIVISEDGEIIGKGYSAPPLNDESQRRCNWQYNDTKKPKYDKTCCVHAEWNAILEACKKYPDKIKNSTLYFMRIDGEGNFTDSGDPYCTVCSRLALQSGISFFTLWQNGQARTYKTSDYNTQSYDFYEQSA